VATRLIFLFRALMAFAVGATFASISCARAADNSGLPLLTNLTAVRLLPAAEASKGYPVEVRAVVVCADIPQAGLYVQAGDEGIYARIPAPEIQMRPGDDILIRAVTAGGGHNFLVNPQLQLLGSGLPIPKPLNMNGAALHDLNLDCRNGTVIGRVERAFVDGPRWQFYLRQGARQFTAQLVNPPGAAMQPAEWIGARVEVTGVASIRLLGTNTVPTVRFACSSLEGLRILDPPNQAKAVKIADLAALAGGDQRLSVSGRTALRDNRLVVRDGTGEIFVPLPSVARAGDEVEIAGFAMTNAAGAINLDLPDVRLIERDTNGVPRTVVVRLDQLRALSVDEAMQRWPVRMTAVVTYYAPNTHTLFVHDGLAGAFAWVEEGVTNLRPGLEVELVGRTSGGLFAPILDSVAVKPGRMRGLPLPRRVTFADLMSGREDSQMVEVSGVVRRAIFTNDVAEFLVAMPGGNFDARSPATREQIAGLEHAKVRIQGVAGGYFNNNRQIIGAQIFIPSMSSITIEEPAAPPFSFKLMPLNSVFGFRQGDDTSRRVRVSGTVTWQAPEGGIYLVDGFDSLFVDAPHDPNMQIGMRAEAVGYPARGGSHVSPILENAVARTMGEGAKLDPAIPPAKALRAGEYDATFTQMRARLLRSFQKADAWHSTWRLDDEDGMIFDAILHGPRAPALEANTVANLQGIVRVQMNDQRQPSGFVLNLRDPGDIAVLAMPPWWNAERAWGALYSLGAVIAISGGWILFLKRKVRQQTSLVRAQLAEQQDLEKQYRDLFVDNPHPMWVYELETLRFLAVNDTALRRYGYSREEFLRMTLLDIRPPAEQERLREYFKENGMRNQDGSVWTHCRKDGSQLWVELTTRQVTFGGRQAKLVLAHDITDRKRAEAERLRLSTAVEQTSEMVVILDREGLIQYLNPSFTRVTGFAAAESIGQRFDFIEREPSAQASFANMVAAMGEQRSWSGLFSSRNKAGERYDERLVLSAVHDESGKLLNYIVVSRDVSKEAALEQQVRLSQKMEAVGLLAGGVAHDFNNLLQVIQGYTLLSLELATPHKELHDNLEHVKSAAERAAQLTRQLLVFSRQQNLEETDIDLGETLADTLKLVRRVIGEHIEVELSSAHGLQKIRADKGRVEQVIVNLCVNARDAMPKGGRLSIQISNATLTAADLGEQSAAAAGPYVCLRVTDTGCGMDSATLARVFEPFFSTKPKDKGTGLGLSVVYGIVELHKGIIRVHSKPGAGTTFLIYFPVSPGGLLNGAPSRASQLLDKGGKETILLVEDEPAVRMLAGRILKRAGYEVRTASDGAEACAIFEEHAAEIDLVLMDVIMPRMGGREAYEHIAKKRVDIPVIFCSGYSERELGAEFLQSHGLDLLPKPYRPDELLTRVRDRLRAVNAG
jgi:PAS domain S-box-containing protein